MGKRELVFAEAHRASGYDSVGNVQDLGPGACDRADT
jgi:hypothetical protein